MIGLYFRGECKRVVQFLRLGLYISVLGEVAPGNIRSKHKQFFHNCYRIFNVKKGNSQNNQCIFFSMAALKKYSNKIC